MKKISLALTILLAISFSALAQSVGSANIMGYSKITVLSNAYLMVSYDFKSDSGETHFNDVFGTNQLTSASRLTSCEIVYAWNSANQSYGQYAQYNGQTYSTADWKGTPTNPIVSGGFFIQARSGNPDHTILLSGNVLTSEIENISISGNGGFNLIQYPFSSGIAISNLNITGATAGSRLTKADIIYRWVGSHYEQYALYTDGKWYNVDDWKITPTSDKIALCEGFWYQGKSNLLWSATNVYYELIN